MSRKIKVALIGRPNVGKSALFNAICKKRKAIVDEQEGVTRDRIYENVEAFGMHFELIDTGGVDARSKALFAEEVRKQTEIAIEEAHSLILVVDVKAGVHELDRIVAKLLHKTKKPLCLAVNKVDNPALQELIHEFYSLDIEPIIPVSATHGFQIAELIEHALQPFTKEELIPHTTDLPKIAIIGRPNVGKSALLNVLVGSERCVVSAIAGTTRDSIDTTITHNDKQYLFIDTAGIRKKHKELEVVEKFAAIRTKEAVERADLCLLVVDAKQGITADEKRIATLIEEAQKGCVILLNKWDLVKGFRMEHCEEAINKEIPFLQNCPKIFISTITKKNLNKIFPAIEHVLTAYARKVPTRMLNKSLASAMKKYHPPSIGGKRLRVYYMTQIDSRPPKFVLFVNSPLLMEASYKRYLINHLREAFDFAGTPLLLNLKGKSKKKPRTEHIAE